MSGGNKELVMLMIKNGANTWNLGLSYACTYGHKELALLMIEKGANPDGYFLDLTDIDLEYLIKRNVMFDSISSYAKGVIIRLIIIEEIKNKLESILGNDLANLCNAY